MNDRRDSSFLRVFLILSLKEKRIKIHNLNYEKKGRGVSSVINVSRNRFKEFEDAWVLLEM